MLSQITDFSYRRNALEAMIFFLVYLVLILLVSALVSFLTERFIDANSAFWAGRFVAGLATTLLAILLLKAKNLSANLGLVMLGFVSGIISLYVSPLLGLLIPTYLSIR